MFALMVAHLMRRHAPQAELDLSVRELLKRTSSTRPYRCRASSTPARRRCPPAVIVAHFYDIESGRKDLADRGKGTAHEQFAIPIPRDGGIHDLLAEAARPDRRFDGMICESIDRVARRTYYGRRSSTSWTGPACCSSRRTSRCSRAASGRRRS